MNEMSQAPESRFRRRNPDGNTEPLTDWGINSEYGTLRHVLLGPAETFRWMMAENAQWSSVVRASERDGIEFDHQVAMRQHREMVEAYEEAGVTVHQHPQQEELCYQVYARDSSFMTPWGAVITQMANPAAGVNTQPRSGSMSPGAFPSMTWFQPVISKAATSTLSSPVRSWSVIRACAVKRSRPDRLVPGWKKKAGKFTTRLSITSTSTSI